MAGCIDESVGLLGNMIKLWDDTKLNQLLQTISVLVSCNNSSTNNIMYGTRQLMNY